VVQVSERRDFSVLTLAQTVAQTVEALERGEVEAVSSVKLTPRTQYYWRVSSVNSVGMSVWSTVATFTTAEKEIAFTARWVEFGRVPLQDTGRGLLRIRNVADSLAWLYGVVPAGTADSSRFALSRSAIGAQGTVFERGAYRDYEVAYIPLELRRAVSGVLFEYGYATQRGQERDRWVQSGRLRGVGSALKLLAPPSLDTILLGLPKVSAALLINRSTNASVEVPQSVIVGGRGDHSVKNGQPLFLGAGDTVAVIIRGATTALGALAPSVLEARGIVRTLAENRVVGLDTGRVELRSYGRRRRSDDLVARLGLRVGNGANRVPPGTVVSVELYLNARESTGRDTLFRQSVPQFGGTVRYGNQVLSAIDGSNGWRKIGNTNRGNRLERLVSPELRFVPQGTEVLGQFRAVVVAGQADTTALEVEDIRWPGVYLVEYETSGFASRPSQAGGKRLIGSVLGEQGSLRITSIAPNPAREEVVVSVSVTAAALVPTSANGAANGQVHGAVELTDARGVVVQRLEQVVLEGGAGDSTEKIVRLRLQSGIPTGVYTVRLTVGGLSATKTIAVQR
jgi:hypothetical protein